MSTKELQQEIISNMRRWQKIENAAAASTGQIMERADNPVIHLLMEIIQRDSQMHYRVQEWIADSLQYKTVTLSPDELSQVWGMIEQHVEVEKKALGMAKQSLDSLKGKKMVIQEYLLEYLAEDERKHNDLLKRLETIKKGMFP
jgi:rubrerythrin